MVDQLKKNAKDLGKELEWFKKLLDYRLKTYFGQPTDEGIPAPPAVKKGCSAFADFVLEYNLEASERALLILTLTPHVRPELLDIFFTQNSDFSRGFTEFGGVKGTNHGGFLPTGETAMFVLGEDLKTRFELQSLFDGDHPLARNGILTLESAPPGEPFLSGRLLLSREIVELLTTGKARKPNFSRDFPAKLITTLLDWEDLVLPQKTMAQVDEIGTWVDHGTTLLDDWGMRKKTRPGMRGLFYGPPGTGKTMTACLLGKRTDRDVYRIDLSMVISKYIGETEENLGKVFNQAENKNWILFFDEADALFGSRVQTESSNDMFANQQVSYLLQRIEDFNGVVILSSNMKHNIDKAFIRRFETIVYFNMPSQQERLRLWENGFSHKSRCESAVDLNEIARKYELSGGAIMNVIRYASLLAIKNNTDVIRAADLETGIRKEFAKEGRTI